MNAAVRAFELLVVPICIVALAWEPNFAHGFINYNESGQHLAAMRGLASGKLLFRDLFGQYGALHYFVPYWATGVFGESITTLRGYFLWGEIAGFLAALGLARALIKNRLFANAAAIAAVVFAHHPFWSTRWGGFRFAFVYLSIWCLVAALRQPGSRALLLAGLTAALAFLHTYDAGAAAGLAGAMYFAHAVVTGRLVAREVGAYGVGLATMLVPFGLYLLATGTFGDYLAQVPLLNPGRAWVQPLGQGALTPSVVAPGFVYLLAIGYLARKAMSRSWEAKEHLPLLLAAAPGLLLYAAAFRAIRGPQFETSLPLVVLTLFFLMSRGFASFERMFDESADRVQGWLGFAFVLLAMLSLAAAEIRTYRGGLVQWANYQTNKSNLVARHSGAKPLDEAYVALAVAGAQGTRVPAKQAAEIEEITRYLIDTTAADDTMLAFPDLGIFNYFAARPHATPFTIAILAAADDEWSEQLATAVREKRPAVVLLGKQLSTLARATGKSREYLPEIPDLVGESYVLEKRFERLDVYRLHKGAAL